jgi:hypothetical protein
MFSGCRECGMTTDTIFRGGWKLITVCWHLKKTCRTTSLMEPIG